MHPMRVATYAFFVVLAIAAILYFRPHFLGRTPTNEGFITVALDGETMPKCLARDADSQALLARFQALKLSSPNSATGMAYDEFKLILQKLLCIDADITGSAAGSYSTYQLPFATAHDIEPAANFVRRCTQSALRSRDIEMAMDKFESRGKELIGQMSFDKKTKKGALSSFSSIVARVQRNIAGPCLTQKATLDHPAGVRDPGYYTPNGLEENGPYQIRGDAPQYL